MNQSNDGRSSQLPSSPPPSGRLRQAIRRLPHTLYRICSRRSPATMDALYSNTEPLPLSAIGSVSNRQYDDAVTARLEEIKKLSPELLAKDAQGQSIFDIIDPAVKTIHYAVALVAQIEAEKPKTKSSAETLWSYMVNFLQHFDERQVRYVGTEWTKIVETVALLAERAQDPAAAILPIAAALRKLDPEGSVLTSHHLQLVRLALESGVIVPALPVLERAVLYFPTKVEPSSLKYRCDTYLNSPAWITYANGFTKLLKSNDVLEYFVLCGTVFICMQQWENAEALLENAVTFPIKDGNGVSKIMVEAYKKWLIVNLLLKGEIVKPPPTTSPHASKAYHTLAKAYDTVATIFENGKADRLKAEIEFGQRTWQADGNHGLMQQVLAAYQKFAIRSLGKVYSRMSVSEVTQMTYSADTGDRLPSDAATETLIRNMIQERSLHAALSRSSNGSLILTFDPPTVLSEKNFQQHLATKTDGLKKLSADVTYTNRRLAQDKDYIKWAQKQKKLGSVGNAGTTDESMNWQSTGDAIDEDLMGF